MASPRSSLTAWLRTRLKNSSVVWTYVDVTFLIFDPPKLVDFGDKPIRQVFVGCKVHSFNLTHEMRCGSLTIVKAEHSPLSVGIA